jgi:aryl-alcohol dehydrogenase-like predicted oxidoreductase
VKSPVQRIRLIQILLMNRFYEVNAADGRIQYYGVATWTGLRERMLEIEDLVEAACTVAGNKHRFRFVQLPINLGMPEAIVCQNDGTKSIVERAVDAGVNVIASASLLQGRLSRDLPVLLEQFLPSSSSDAQRALQFARSIPRITSALVGMRNHKHVTDNLKLSKYPRLTAAEFERCNFFHE